MKVCEYDYLFVTNLPAFYKVRLYNEIANKKNIFAVFINITAIRDKDFSSAYLGFDKQFISGSPLEQCCKLVKILKNAQFKKLVVCGWDCLPFFISPLFSRKDKNICVVESSIYESSVTGLKALVKKSFLRRFSMCFVAGQAQQALIEQLGFKGTIKLSGGCGILNYLPQPEYSSRNLVKNFLYVGRFIPCKNLQFLIEVFNDNPALHLDLIGYGPMESYLRSIAEKNVTVIGQIPNKKLPAYYKRADVFILPSLTEVWGLVVEEALNNGTPIMVSSRVGSRNDLINESTGLVFDPFDKDDLQDAISRIVNVDFYNNLRKGISKINFDDRAKQQINTYLENE